MRRSILILIAVFILLTTVSIALADMSSYCMMPPYVKTDVFPYISIIMDNEKKMGGPVYDYTWTTNVTFNDSNIKAFPSGTCPDVNDPIYSRLAMAYDPSVEYRGLFNSGAWYNYESSQFKPNRNGVFDGNLLNFLTTSQYDLMMGILVGGKSTSRQTNVNRLIGYNFGIYPCDNGTTIVPWDRRVFKYTGTDGNTYACEFIINDSNRGDLTISDSSDYYNTHNWVCGLIKGSTDGLTTSGNIRPWTSFYFVPKISQSATPESIRYAHSTPAKGSIVSILSSVASYLNSFFEWFSAPAEAVGQPLNLSKPNAGAKFNLTLFQDMTAYQCDAAGGSGVYTYSASGLPSGISICQGPTDGTWNATTQQCIVGSNSYTRGTIYGVPTNETQIGNVSVTITVNDGSTTDSKTVTFQVAGTTPAITAPASGTYITAATRGQSYSYQPTASGGCNPNAGPYGTGITCSYYWDASGLPTGLTITHSTGLISGAVSGASGDYTVTLTVHDNYNPTVISPPITAHIVVSNSLHITQPTTSLTDASVNSVYSGYTCLATGGAGTYVWSVDPTTPLPAGMAMSAGGVISGTPTVSGNFTLKIQVHDDAESQSVTVSLRVIVGIVITAPSTQFKGAYYGENYYYQCQASGGNGPGTYSWSVTSWGGLTGLSIDSSTGVITGIPGSAPATYSVTLHVTSGTYEQTQSYNLTVHGVTITWPSIHPTDSPNYFVFGDTINGLYYPNRFHAVAKGCTTATSCVWSAVGLPDGLKIDPSTGIISGTETIWPGTFVTDPLSYYFNQNEPYAYTATITVHDTSTFLSDSVYLYGWNETNTASHYIVTDGWCGDNSVHQMPDAVYGNSYQGYSFGTYYGDGQSKWKIISGSLPPGMSLDVDGSYLGSGLIYGTPSGAGALGCHDFTIEVVKHSANINDPSTWVRCTNSDYRNMRLCVTGVNAPSITTPATDNIALPPGSVGVAYSPYTAVAGGGIPFTAGDGTKYYNWSLSGLGGNAGAITISSAGVISGTPTTTGDFTVTITVTDSVGQFSNRIVRLQIGSASLPMITSPATLPDAYEQSYYQYNCLASGGSGHYQWQITSGALPSGLSLSFDGVISGTPANGTTLHGADPYYHFTLRVTDSSGNSATQDVSLYVSARAYSLKTASFNINICASSLTSPYDINCDSAQIRCTTDADCTAAPLYLKTCNNNTCEIKQGILQNYWDRAYFGMVDFSNQLDNQTNLHDPLVDQCVPASPQSSFFTGVENALPVDGVTPLILGEKMGVQVYIGIPSGANRCETYVDPNDSNADATKKKEQPCRKNFILMITGGLGADTPNWADNTDIFTTGMPAACTGLTYKLAKNACYGYENDLQNHPAPPDPANPPPGYVSPPDIGMFQIDGKQNVTTYVVNAMGDNGDILRETANAGGGLYYYSANANELQKQIEQALNDIIKRAASGTAASVLASGEGSGANLIQAVFYPKRKFFDTIQQTNSTVAWVGRLSNFWYYIDPYFVTSSIYEDTVSDGYLDITADYKVALRYDNTKEQVEADRWYNSNGDGQTYTQTSSVPFEDLSTLWEAGLQLWQRDLTADPRTIYTNCSVDSSKCLTDANGLDTGLMNFSIGNASSLQPYLNLADNPTTQAIIRYTKGEDTPFSPAIAGFTSNLRSRMYDISGTQHVWKLGDVLNSTPKISSWIPLNTYNNPSPYNDSSYASYLATTTGSTADYQHRGMVFAGGNDGMLHAFKLGALELPNHHSALCSFPSDQPGLKACLKGSNLGREEWAFIPKNVLPYLQYYADQAYPNCHVYSVDLTPYIFDASIGKPADCGATTPYWDCTREWENADHSNASWRTILIGGMRFGGACKNIDDTTCPNCVKTPMNGVGYSAYFALDITDQENPKLMWEFTHPDLGFTTTGPSVVRINGRDPSGTPLGSESAANKLKNGRWFAVIGSGPTGLVDTDHAQFLGISDQHLKIFVLDLLTGQIATKMDGATGPIDTNIPDAFAGSMLNATHDADGDYQDDVLYIPYIRKCTASDLLSLNPKCSSGTWNNGGVLRILTNEDLNGGDRDGASGNTALNPGNFTSGSGLPTGSTWKISTVMDNIGPVSSAVAKLQNQRTGQMWLYFGTGRYYYKTLTTQDDPANQRYLFGITEPCYNWTFDTSCTTSRSISDLSPVDLSVATGVSNTNGWYVNLDPAGQYTVTINGSPKTAQLKPERVITDPLASTSGVVYFTTFAPYTDACDVGGTSHLWALKYDTAAAPGALLKGKAIIQVSTGAIEQIDMQEAFTAAKGGDKTGRRTSALEGVPPGNQGLSILSQPPPVKRVIHMQER